MTEGKCPLGEHSGICANIENVQKDVTRLEGVDAEQWKAINDFRKGQTRILFGVLMAILGIAGQILLTYFIGKG
jgi:hypothetical protein